MLEKYLDIPSFFGDVPSIRTLGSDITKVASHKFTKSEEDAIMPSTLEFMRNLQSSDRYVYLLVIPIGVGQVWGYNLRNDLVPYEHLVPDTTSAEYRKRPYGYRTFVDGHFFYHHKNKPNEGHIIYGDVPFAEFNPYMRLVETVVRVDLEQVKRYQPDDLDVILAGQFDVSMGLRAAADMCSVCRNVRRTIRDKACVHIQPPIIGTIYPNGVVAGMINLFPIFEDISRVWHGADSIGHSLAKVASDPGKEQIRAAVKKVLYGTSLATPGRARPVPKRRYGENDLEKVSKEVPEEQLRELHRVAKDLGDREKTSPLELLQARKKPGGEGLLPALSARGVMLRPEEFQTLALPQDKAAQCVIQRVSFTLPLDSVLSGLAGVVPEDIRAPRLDPAALQLLHGMDGLSGRSWLPNDLTSRISDLTFGSSPGAGVPWGRTAMPDLVAPYILYLLSTLQNTLSRAQDVPIEKDASWPLMAAVLPALYFGSLLYRDAMEQAEPFGTSRITPFQAPVQQIPNLTLGTLPIMAPIGPPFPGEASGGEPRTLLEQLILWNPSLGTSLLNLARMGASKVMPVLSGLGRAL